VSRGQVARVRLSTEEKKELWGSKIKGKGGEYQQTKGKKREMKWRVEGGSTSVFSERTCARESRA